jgi:hypothetical protein
MWDNLKVKIAAREKRTWSEVQPQEFVLAYIAGGATVLLHPLGDSEENGRIKEHSTFPAITSCWHFTDMTRTYRKAQKWERNCTWVSE